MITYGNRTQVLGSVYFSHPCGRCKKYGFEVKVYQVYFHVLGIPVLPRRKELVAECQVCKVPTPFDELTLAQREAFSPAALAFSTPLSSCAGLAFAFVLIGNMGYSEWREYSRFRSYLNHPEKGDILIVAEDSRKFNLMKVADVINEEVIIFPGKYSYLSKQRAKNSLSVSDQAEHLFHESGVPVQKGKLRDMKIQHVVRK